MVVGIPVSIPWKKCCDLDVVVECSNFIMGQWDENGTEPKVDPYQGGESQESFEMVTGLHYLMNVMRNYRFWVELQWKVVRVVTIETIETSETNETIVTIVANVTIVTILTIVMSLQY